jgi:secreted trypsin-like serine protease
MARSVRGLVGILVVFAALAVGGGAQGVIGGPDNGHAYVGAAIQLQTRGDQTGYQLCSGFLISATKFVTDAHCFPNNDQPIQVTFDGVTAPAKGVLVAINPITGTVVNNPGFCPACGKSGTALNDVAVITLSQPHNLSSYASVPAPGADDALSNKQEIDVVGYGWSDVAHKAPTGPPPVGFGTRQVATTHLASAGVLADNYLALLDSPGACQGDSGGPALISGSDIAVAVTTFGNGNPNCNGVQYSQRLDTAAIQSFIFSA